MNCTNCGAQLMPGAQICPNCGAPVAAAPQNYAQQPQYQQPQYQQPYQQQQQQGYGYAVSNEDATVGFKLLSFFIPLVGLILYFTEKDKAPKKAESCLTFAGVGFGAALFATFL